jgi:trimethylamine:corrinoid methyltransferase-like protein
MKPPDIGYFSDLAVQIRGVASPTDILTRMGCVDPANGISFGQLVIDAYIWECVREFMKEVYVPEERIGLDAIEEVGHGHQFLKSKHTRRFMRDEITQWDPAKLEMLKSDAATVITEVNSIAEQLLKDHEVLEIEESLNPTG